MELATTQCMLPRVGEMAETGELHCDQHVDVLCQQLYQLQQQQVLCDVIINVDDMYIGAHSSVLAACSVTLNRMLMTEVLHMQNTRPLKLNVKDVNINSLTEILRFMYTGRLSLTPLTVKQIMACCEKWGLQKAIDLCSEFMWPNVSRGCGVNVSDSQTNYLQYNEDNVGGNSDYDQVNPGHQGDLIDMKNPVSLHPVVISQDSCYGQDNTGMPSLLYATVKLEPQERLSVETPSGSTVPEHQLCLGQEPTRKKVGRPRRKLQNIEANKTQGIGPGADKEASDTFVIVNTEKHTVDVSGESMDTLDANTYTPDYPHLKLEVTEEEEMREKNGTIEVKTQEDDFSGQVMVGPGSNELLCKEEPETIAKKNMELFYEGNPIGEAVYQQPHGMAVNPMHQEMASCQMPKDATASEESEEVTLHQDTQDTKEEQANDSKKATPKYFYCKICPYKSTIGSNLRRHSNTHLAPDERHYHSCPVCSLKYVAAYKLREHMRRIHGGQVVQCDSCNENFNSREALLYHKRSKHTYTGTYQCQFCRKRFVKKQQYEGHMNGHLGVRSYECSTCKKTFIFKHSLVKHQRVCHENSEKYVCHLCGREYSRNCSLKDHLKAKHGDSVVAYKCVCGRHYPWRRSLHRHKITCEACQS